MNIVNRIKLAATPKYSHIFGRYKGKEFALLDVGCGNHSPSLARRYFPNVRYYGIDKEIYNNDDGDLGAMEKFYAKDLDRDPLDDVPDNYFDAVIFSHVIEHLNNGDRVLRELVSKLKPGGRIYVEFPNLTSLSLPSSPLDTLNFYDDPSHVRLYDLKETTDILLERNCKILRSGTRRNMVRIAVTPFLLLYHLLRGKFAGSALRDLTGFADYVYAVKIR